MLKGIKVCLRPIRRNDIDLLNTWKNNEEVYMYLGGGFRPISVDQQGKWLDSMIDLTGNDRRFMIVDQDDKPVGMIGLYGIDWVNRNCEIGVYIGDFASRGKGYASEACSMIEEYAFSLLNLRKIKLKVVSDNEKAVKMWKKLGYSQVGEYMQERYINGKYCNVKIMEKFTRGGVKSDFADFTAWGGDVVRAA